MLVLFRTFAPAFQVTRASARRTNANVTKLVPALLARLLKVGMNVNAQRAAAVHVKAADAAKIANASTADAKSVLVQPSWLVLKEPLHQIIRATAMKLVCVDAKIASVKTAPVKTALLLPTKLEMAKRLMLGRQSQP